jgi:hypothetical protein
MPSSKAGGGGGASRNSTGGSGGSGAGNGGDENTTAATATYRISIRPNGDTQANQHYIAYDTPISGNDTVALTLGLTADAADVFTIYASSANLSFNLFGSEIDV